MEPLQRAYCELMLARGVWRAAKDVEAQVAHWLLEGAAAHADLRAAREREKAAKAALTRVQRTYQRMAEALLRRAS
ncbi:MAG: hypothetical protein OJF49_000284 [Ktedonobacterales bacterium]|jgi:L-arabinose isomerase|nr:MAG: hypothetical protein OJF49_000284 [Ktedonobacterales bacterium]